MIKHAMRNQMTDVEQRLLDAHNLLQTIKENYILLRYYPYLDEDRSEARAVEKEIEAFLKLPLFDGETPE